MFLNRLYCLEELLSYERQIHEKYKLSNIVVLHECGHRYRVKQGGIKESAFLHNQSLKPLSALQNEKMSQKTCSVCFKLRVDSHENIDNDIIQSVCEQEGTKKPTVVFLKNKNVFYQWLYKHLFL